MKYTHQQIQEMREQCCEFEDEMLDINDTYCLLMEGCTGWKNMDDDSVIEYWESHVKERVTEN